MKALLRAALVQTALAALLSGYLRLAFRTIRWRRIGLEKVEPVWGAGGPVILCFWHSRIPLSPVCWPLDRGQTGRALISKSADGELTAMIMERLGFPSIRGSSRNPSRPGVSKGGTEAFLAMLRWLRGPHMIAVTPDGPRGPAEVMGEGPPQLARLSGATVMLVGLACRPCLRLPSWDRAVIPLPFGRGAIVWDGPERVSKKTELEPLQAIWAERLSAVTAAAEAALR